MACVDIGGMVVSYFCFWRVARHRQPEIAEDEEKKKKQDGTGWWNYYSFNEVHSYVASVLSVVTQTGWILKWKFNLASDMEEYDLSTTL